MSSESGNPFRKIDFILSPSDNVCIATPSSAVSIIVESTYKAFANEVRSQFDVS